LQNFDWLYQLIPSVISIFIILFSTRANRFLEKRINSSSANAGEKSFAMRVALDWGARLGFHSAMLAAVGGALVAATDPFRQWLVIMVFLAVAAVWFIAQLALWGEHFGELHEGKVSLATKLDLTLILHNVGIVLIFVLNHPGRRATLCELLAKLWPG
jgi:hypothetical protein